MNSNEELDKILSNVESWLTHQKELDVPIFISDSDDTVYQAELDTAVIDKRLNQIDENFVTAKSLTELDSIINNCMKCELGSKRKKFVFGVGNHFSEIVFVGEAPGRDEDEQGEPFVGRAGKLLNEMLKEIGLKREEVFICNILKCRPPGNRDPLPNEVEKCEPYLLKQLSLLKPKIIVALGRIAGNTLLKTSETLTNLRKEIYDYYGIPLVVTFHPAAILRNPHWKTPTLDDLKKAKKYLEEVTN
ncbi:MAG: uracil-DNA glycosylase [Ignavibacteria bacterium]|nr:uracil-DNA glycosylase [Ignavibacteria bacterium]